MRRCRKAFSRSAGIDPVLHCSSERVWNPESQKRSKPRPRGEFPWCPRKRISRKNPMDGRGARHDCNTPRWQAAYSVARTAAFSGCQTRIVKIARVDVVQSLHANHGALIAAAMDRRYIFRVATNTNRLMKVQEREHGRSNTQSGDFQFRFKEAA
jgi:hypothetical protein